jgi:hypothetical protein
MGEIKKATRQAQCGGDTGGARRIAGEKAIIAFIENQIEFATRTRVRVDFTMCNVFDILYVVFSNR